METPMQAGPSGGGRLPRGWWLVLIAFTASLYLWQLGPFRYITGHECHNVEAAREMVATGDWLVPRVAGQPWVEKPPLPHWCMAVAQATWQRVGALTGSVEVLPSAGAARLPGALAGLLGVLVITSLAVRWFGPTRGLLTGLVQASTLYTITYARLAESDIFLWLSVVACLAVFARHFVEPRAADRWYSGRLAFFLLLGATQLSKGILFGAVIVLLPCLAFLLLKRSWAGWKWLLSLPGILLTVAIASAWPLAVWWIYPEAADLWHKHLFGRLDSATCFNPEPPWYYLTTMPWQLLPWTLMMLPALPDSLRRAWREPDSPDRFLWLWLLVPLVVLSAATAKHHHYLIHALPPCAFWAADGLLRVRLWLTRGLNALAAVKPRPVCVIALIVVMLLGVAAGTWFTPAAHRMDVVWLAGLAGGGIAGVLLGCARARYRLAAVCLFACLWAVYGYVHAAMVLKLDHFTEETAMLIRIADSKRPGEPLIVFRIDPARMLLYVPEPVEFHIERGKFVRRVRELSTAQVITNRKQEAELEAAGRVTRIDGAEPRWREHGAGSALTVYRVEWQPRRASSGKISSTPR